MNAYMKNLNRIEFLITLACTGRCRHCSEGDHAGCTDYIDGDAAARLVRSVCGEFGIELLMTFGGEPLLHVDVTCKIHAAARDVNIPKRQIITNGFFSRDEARIEAAAAQIAQSGVNDLLLSVDAFHQETIPLEPVKVFAAAVKAAGVPIRTHPAWLVSPEDGNPFNVGTRGILAEFENMGISPSDGNVIFPSGNALKYLSEYFEAGSPENPYEGDSRDVTCLCVAPNGDVLNGNIYRTDILKLIADYVPDEA